MRALRSRQLPSATACPSTDSAKPPSRRNWIADSPSPGGSAYGPGAGAAGDTPGVSQRGASEVKIRRAHRVRAVDPHPRQECSRHAVARVARAGAGESAAYHHGKWRVGLCATARQPRLTGSNPWSKLSATESNSEQLRSPQTAEERWVRLDRSGWGPGGRRFK